MRGERVQLVGCGILRREVAWLVRENRWALDLDWLDSALHIDFDRLEQALTSALAQYPDKVSIVFYGDCHPNMEQILRTTGACRLRGQNCVEMLLGEPAFTEELSNGAFFLLEDWALRWKEVVTKTLGENREVIRDIFQGDRKYLLGLKTPCSGNFEAAAVEAARMVNLPLRWRTASLDHLASVLAEALKRFVEGTTCPK